MIELNKDSPCINCITKAICQGRKTTELMIRCKKYSGYLHSKGWSSYRGNLFKSISNASTTSHNANGFRIYVKKLKKKENK
jgi:hypothetical protein